MYTRRTRGYIIILYVYLTYGCKPVIEGGGARLGKKMNNDPQRRRRSRSRRRPCVVFFCPGHKSRTVRTVSTHRRRRRRWRCCCCFNRDMHFVYYIICIARALHLQHHELHWWDCTGTFFGSAVFFDYYFTKTFCIRFWFSKSI